MIDDTEPARRSILGFGEMFATFARSSAGPEAEVRRPNAVGARIDAAAYHPFFSSAVVSLGAVPPADDPRLPRYLWTVADAVPGRVEEAQSAMPCMGVALDDPASKLDRAALEIEEPSLAVLGDINEHAYGETGFSPLARAVRDDRIRTHGLRGGGPFVCVAMTLAVGDDLGIHYVATEASHRRRGLASRLVRAVMAAARDEGMRSATLQASADGLPVWERLGFRRVATLRAYLRPDVSI